MLDEESLHVVQVCTRPDLMPDLTSACIERGIAVMSEKPLAMDLATLTRLYEQALERDVLVLPMHAMRSNKALATVSDVIRTGRVGSPLVSSHQKSYKWGHSRPDYYRSRQTFPGIAPWVGIHAFDWMVWMMGDAFTGVYGVEDMTARPTYAGCASQAGYVFEMRNGCVAVVSLDYLRPEAASSHGDERVRIAGSKGVVESALIEDRVTLITSDQGLQSLTLVEVPYWYTTFVQAVVEETRPFMDMWEAFRITEIALKAQQSADTGKPVSLEDSPYRYP
jgi:predicted dehydrogenase